MNYELFFDEKALGQLKKLLEETRRKPFFFSKQIIFHMVNNCFVGQQLNIPLNTTKTMGFLDFLKPKPKTTTITLDEVPDWADKYIEKQEIGTKIGMLKREIHSKTTKLKELLEALEKAHPKNPEAIPERAISVMQGNKKSYIQKINNFLKQLSPPERYEETQNFLEKTSEDLEKLEEDTRKNYYILKDIIGDETRAIAKKIVEIDKTIANARQTFEKSPLEKTNEIKNHLKEYYEAKEQVKKLRQEAEEIEKNKLAHYEKRSKIEQKIKQYQQGTGYKDFQKLKEKLEETKNKLKEQKDKVTKQFSDIEPALKKYAKRKRNNLLKKYLDNAEKALEEDKNLEITKHVEELKKKLPELELKKEKEARIKKQIQSITKKSLEETRKKMISLEEETKDLEKRISNHSTHLNIKEQKGWLEHTDKNIELENKKLEEIENQLERINPNLTKNKIKNLIKQLSPETELQ